MLSKLDGYKTFIIAALGGCYALYHLYIGEPVGIAEAMAWSAAGFAALRDGMKA